MRELEKDVKEERTSRIPFRKVKQRLKTWIYFLNTKSEVFGKFKEFKALIENHSERRSKTLRSDNGGEYTSR